MLNARPSALSAASIPIRMESGVFSCIVAGSLVDGDAIDASATDLGGIPVIRAELTCEYCLRLRPVEAPSRPHGVPPRAAVGTATSLRDPSNDSKPTNSSRTPSVPKISAPGYESIREGVKSMVPRSASSWLPRSGSNGSGCVDRLAGADLIELS